MSLVGPRCLTPTGHRPLACLSADGAIRRSDGQPVLGAGVTFRGLERLQLEGERDALMGLLRVGAGVVGSQRLTDCSLYASFSAASILIRPGGRSGCLT